MTMTTAARLFAVNTYSYTQSHRVRDCVAALADRGYAEFELMMYPGHLWPAETDASERNQLRRSLAERNLVVRTLNIGKSSRDLAVRAANAGSAFALVGGVRVQRRTEDGFEVIRIPAAATPLNLALIYGETSAAAASTAQDLRAFTRGGPGQWLLSGKVKRGKGVPQAGRPLRANNPIFDRKLHVRD